MKKLYALLASVVLLSGSAVPVLAANSGDNVDIQARMDAMMTAVNNGRLEVSTQADRYNADVNMVMHLNGITRTEAIARIARALLAQNGFMPAPPIAKGYGVAYDPAPHAFRQALSRAFYAGIDKDGRLQFSDEQRQPLLDSFWYCKPGLTFSYDGLTSSCR